MFTECEKLVILERICVSWWKDSVWTPRVMLWRGKKKADLISTPIDKWVQVIKGVYVCVPIWWDQCKKKSGSLCLYFYRKIIMSEERVPEKLCEIVGRNALIRHFILSWETPVWGSPLGEGNKVEPKFENTFFNSD